MIYKGEELFKLLSVSVDSDKAQFPPKVFELLKGEFIEYVEGKSIKMRYPIQTKFDNPFHITFGGTLGMYFDMTFGPFSGLVTQAATTSLDLNICFLKTLSIADEYVYINAHVVSQSKQFLTLRADAYKGDNILVGTATSRMMIFNPNRIKR